MAKPAPAMSVPVGEPAREADQRQHHDLVQGDEQARDLAVPLRWYANELGQDVGLGKAQEADNGHDRQAYI